MAFCAHCRLERVTNAHPNTLVTQEIHTGTHMHTRTLTQKTHIHTHCLTAFPGLAGFPLILIQGVLKQEVLTRQICPSCHPTNSDKELKDDSVPD